MDTLEKAALDVVSPDTLKSLLERSQWPSVSVFMPVHRVGAEVQQNAIRLRNLLREAENRLVAAGIDPAAAEKMFKRVHKIGGDDLFWQRGGDGFALFITPGEFEYFWVPVPLEEIVVEAGRFYISPLLPLLVGNGRFYVLALSMNEVRLLEGTRYTVRQLPLPTGVPRSLDEAMKYDDFEKQQQLYTGTPGWGGGKPGAILYGHGVGSDVQKEHILRYFQAIDRGLHHLPRNSHKPLVLAGVEYLLPIYHQANSYPHLVEAGIEGNPEAVSPEELRAQGWTIVRPIFEAAQREAFDRYMQLAGTGQTSGDITEVLPAAYYGQVDTLFVASGLRLWGTFEPPAREVTPHESMQPGDEDLLALAVAYTLSNRGTIYAVDPDKIPGDTPVAALLRY